VVKRKILIVDDQIVVAKGLEGRLTRLGYEVAGIASSEDEGIAMIAKATPDLVLMDIRLRDDVNRVGADNKPHRYGNLPVVFMIGEEDAARMRPPRVAEPHGYLVRPFTESDLRVNIEVTLCKRDTASAVHEMEDRFFTASIDMLCFLDFNGYFKRINPAWERTLGYSREELMSRPFIEFVHPDDRERTLKQNAQVRGGGQALAFENRYLCKDGSFRWFRWNAAPDSFERVIYSVARDITESKKAEEEREQLVSELRSALAEVKTLRQILPLCSYCRKIRDDENYWDTVENYISRHTSTMFSHGICPSCMATVVEAELEKMGRE
jgi:PAS domain S-box-containing protein